MNLPAFRVLIGTLMRASMLLAIGSHSWFTRAPFLLTNPGSLASDVNSVFKQFLTIVL